MYEQVNTQFNEGLVVKSANIISWLDGCERHGHVLKRTISADNLGCNLKLEERHVRSVLDKCGVCLAKAVVTPVSKESSKAAISGAKPLDSNHHRKYRSLARLCQHMGYFRYDTRFETKEVMRDASNRTVGSVQQINRFVRYLKGRPRCMLSFVCSLIVLLSPYSLRTCNNPPGIWAVFV